MLLNDGLTSKVNDVTKLRSVYSFKPVYRGTYVGMFNSCFAFCPKGHRRGNVGKNHQVAVHVESTSLKRL